MPTSRSATAGDSNDLVLRLIAGDARATDEVLARAVTTRDPAVLVAAAVTTGTTEPLRRAEAIARTPRDRQLVVLAAAHLRGDADLLDVLVREHLAEFPDHVLASWIAGAPSRPTDQGASPCL